MLLHRNKTVCGEWKDGNLASKSLLSNWNCSVFPFYYHCKPKDIAFFSPNWICGFKWWEKCVQTPFSHTLDNKIIMINRKNNYFFRWMLSCVHIFLYLCNLKNRFVFQWHQPAQHIYLQRQCHDCQPMSHLKACFTSTRRAIHCRQMMLCPR